MSWSWAGLESAEKDSCGFLTVWLVFVSEDPLAVVSPLIGQEQDPPLELEVVEACPKPSVW